MHQTNKITDVLTSMNCILDLNEYKNFQCGLYLGDVIAAQDLKLLRDKNIRTVLTCAGNLEVFYSNLVTHHIYEDMIDYENYNISKHFDQTYKAIEEGLQKGSVLVHCQEGVSRSPTIVIAYLMLKNKWKYPQAFILVKHKRYHISPNEGFVQQLKQLENKIFSEIFLEKRKFREKNNDTMNHSFKTNYSRGQSAGNKRKDYNQLPQLAQTTSKDACVDLINELTNNKKINNANNFYDIEDDLMPHQQKNSNNRQEDDQEQNFIKQQQRQFLKTNSQKKLMQIAEKLSKEESELAYNKFEYKPGFKRNSVQGKKQSFDNTYDENSSKKDNPNIKQSNVSKLNNKISKNLENLQEQEEEAEKKMRDLEQFLINPYQDEDMNFNDAVYKKFLQIQKETEDQENQSSNTTFKNQKRRIMSAKTLPNKNKENFQYMNSEKQKYPISNSKKVMFQKKIEVIGSEDYKQTDNNNYQIYDDLSQSNEVYKFFDRTDEKFKSQTSKFSSSKAKLPPKPVSMMPTSKNKQLQNPQSLYTYDFDNEDF